MSDDDARRIPITFNGNSIHDLEGLAKANKWSYAQVCRKSVQAVAQGMRLSSDGKIYVLSEGEYTPLRIVEESEFNSKKP